MASSTAVWPQQLPRTSESLPMAAATSGAPPPLLRFSPSLRSWLATCPLDMLHRHMLYSIIASMPLHIAMIQLKVQIKPSSVNAANLLGRCHDGLRS